MGSRSDGGEGVDAGPDTIADMIADMREVAASTETAALHHEKESLTVHMCEKRDNLALRLQIMRLKYASYHRVLDRLNLSIIIISSLSAVVESIKAELGLNDPSTTDPSAYHFLQLLPVITSCTTGLVAAIIKFRKYNDRLEALGRTIERCIAASSRLSRAIDTVSTSRSLDDMDTHAATIAEVLDTVACTLTATASVLKYADIVHHMPRYHELTLTYLAEEQAFRHRTSDLLAGGGAGIRILDGPTLRPTRRTTQAAIAAVSDGIVQQAGRATRGVCATCTLL